MNVSAEPSEANAASFSAHHDDVFARIAGRYDVLCDLFSLGVHRLWKRRMVARMSAHHGGTIFDAASGTGDIPLRLLRRGLNRDRTLWVSDLCPQMLAMAQRKLASYRPDVKIVARDAENLHEVESESVDLYSIAFGMKICDRHKVLDEAFRVLRPGGTFFCLEAAQISPRFLHGAYLRYMDWCLPLIGRVAANGDASAYDYLLQGVHEFPEQTAFAGEIERAGFRDVRFENLTLGIVALHEGTKPLS